MGWDFILQTILLIVFVVAAVVGTTWAIANKFFRPYKDLLQDVQKVLNGIKKDYEDWIQLLRRKHQDEMKQLESKLKKDMEEAVKSKDTEKKEMAGKILNSLEELIQEYETQKGLIVKWQRKYSGLLAIVDSYDKQHGTNLRSYIDVLDFFSG